MKSVLHTKVSTIFGERKKRDPWCVRSSRLLGHVSQRFKSRLPLTQLWIQIETRLKNCTGCGKAYCRVSAEPHFPSSALWNYFEPRDYFHLVTIIAKHLVEAMWRSHEDIQEAKSQHPWHYSESPSQAPISWPCRAGATACNLCLQHQLPLFTRLVDTPIKLIERIQEGHLGEHHFPKPIGSRHLKFHVQKHSDWQYHTRKKKANKTTKHKVKVVFIFWCVCVCDCFCLGISFHSLESLQDSSIVRMGAKQTSQASSKPMITRYYQPFKP